MPRSRERGIKDRIRGRVGGEKKDRGKNRVQVFLIHTFLTKFPVFWWFCWTNLIVGVQTAARGVVCVFCRSHFEDIWEREFRRWFFRRHSREDRAESVTKRSTHVQVAGRIKNRLKIKRTDLFSKAIRKNLLCERDSVNHSGAGTKRKKTFKINMAPD